MHHSQELATSIDQRLSELRQEISSLQAARTAMADTHRQPARLQPRAKPSAAKPARSKRSGATLSAGALEALLGDSDGLTTTDLAHRTRTDRQQVLKLLREGEDADRIRRTGQRRGTRWHLITDEHRIAARVAELEPRGHGARRRARRH